MDQIRPWLFIGAYRDTLNQSYLAFKSIQAMLQLAEKVEQLNIVSLYLPVEDLTPISNEHIRKGVDFIKTHKAKGNRVLVSCGAGINRSSAFCAAAFKEVKKLHPESMPHEPVWQSLCKYYGEEIPYLEIMRLGFIKG